MKKLLFIFLFYGCTKSQSQFFYHMIEDGVRSHRIDVVKDIVPVVDSPIYEGFGIPVQNKVNQITYYYASGATHTTTHNFSYRTFNIAAGVLSEPTLVSDTLFTTVTGGKMDNDSVAFFLYTNSGTRYLYIMKCDSNNVFSPPVAFNWGAAEDLNSGFFFGPMIIGDAPGEYYNCIYQVSGSRYKITIFKTTNYWNNYSEIGTIFDGTTQYSEPAGINLGGGKFLVLCRNNQAGSLTPFESTDYGVTWVRRNSSNLYWNLGGLPEIAYVYGHDGVFDIFYQCRDAAMMQISKNNTVTASSFGTPFPVYNDPEIYSHHLGTGGNPSLGYGAQLKIHHVNPRIDGKYFMIYSKEYNNVRANLQWTMDDLVTDPGGIPSAPTISTSNIGTTTFRITETGYSDSDLENVRYMQFDVSTHADFSDFVTAKYRSVSAFPAVELHDIRMTGLFCIFNVLTTGTTYYCRVKACNNVGCSAYTTVIVTTL